MSSAGDAIEVTIHDAQRVLAVDHAELVAWTRATLRGEGVTRAVVGITLVDNAGIGEINRRHLDHDWPTDVITFDLSDPGGPLTADLVLSAEMAADTGTDPRTELALYLVHGLLHLCGCDDATPDAAARMRQRESEALGRLGIENPFNR